MDDERWLPVEGWPYEVSDLGRVRTVPHTVTRANGSPYRVGSRILRHGTVKGGYQVVMLKDLDRKATRKVHHLVLEAFVGPRPDGTECLHGPGGPADNRLGNLRWGTRSENAHDKKRDGTDHNVNKDRCPEGHEYTPENTYVKPGKTSRDCRICLDAAKRRYVEKNRDEINRRRRERRRCAS